MPETETGEGPTPEIPQKPEKEAASKLSTSLGKLRGLSWKTIRSAITGKRRQAEREAKGKGVGLEEVAELRQLPQRIEETAKALLKKREGWDYSDISRKTREWIEFRKKEASLEERAGLEEAEKRVNDFDAKLIAGEISSDPEVFLRQFFINLAGVEGVDVAEILGKAVSQLMQREEKPYPWEPRPELKIGLSRWHDPRFVGCLVPLTLCVLSTLLCPEAGRRTIKRTVGRIPIAGPLGSRLWTGTIEWGIREKEGFLEDIEKEKEEQIREQVREDDARGLILGTYPYSRILGLEEQGNEDLALARLDRAAEFIAQGEYKLDQIHDPRLIARLIHDERYKEYEFSSDQIKDPEKHRKVEELLKELEEKEKEEKEESSLRPSSRKTAEARERQRLTSVQTRARRGKVMSRRERGLV